MKIEFELNDKQTEVLGEVIANSDSKEMPPNEVCKTIVLTFIIQSKQQLIARDLK